MPKKKNPVDDFNLDDELKGLDSLDDLESNFNFDMDEEDIDTGSDREPIDEQKGIGNLLKNGALLVAGGAAGGITNKMKYAFPEVNSTVDEAMGFLSDANQLKYEFTREIDPVLNQAKNVTRRISSKLTDTGVMPKSINDKIQKAFSTEDYGGKPPSKEESESAFIGESIKNIFQAQHLRDTYKDKEDSIDKFIDRKSALVRHRDLSGLLTGIYQQSVYNTGFIKGPYTGYLKKSLELKYQHLFVAKDTLEILRLHAQNMDRRMEAIRHNTALPDSQKETTMETFKMLSKTALMTKFQDFSRGYGTKILKNIKDNILDPTKDFAGMFGDLMEGMEMAVDMNADMAEMSGRKPKGLMQHVGAGAGKLAGSILGKTTVGNFLKKNLEPYKNNIEYGAANAKTKLIMKLNHFRKHGGKEDTMFEEGGLLHGLAELLLPELGNDLGGSDNRLLREGDKAVPFDLSTRQSIVEIIPGYLSKILQQVTVSATGRPAQEMVYDVYKRDFVTQSQYQAEMTDRLFGDKKFRTQAMSGSLTSIKSEYVSKGKSWEQNERTLKFDDLAEEISKFVFNMGHQKEYNGHWLDDLKTMINSNGDLKDTSNLFQAYFKGIKNKKEVAEIIYNMTHHQDGSIDVPGKNKFEYGVLTYMTQFMDQHKDKIFNIVETHGNSRYLKDVFTTTKYGKVLIDEDKHRERVSDLDKDELAKGDMTKYAVDELKRERDERENSNSLINRLLKGRKRDFRLDKNSKSIMSRLKESMREVLIKLRVPEKWLDKIFGKRPEDLNPYDHETLEALSKEGINLDRYLNEYWKNQRPDFVNEKGANYYKNKRQKDKENIVRRMDKYGEDEEEATRRYHDDKIKHRNEEYGTGTKTPLQQVKSTLHKTKDITKDIGHDILHDTKYGKVVLDKYNTVFNWFDEEQKKYFESHPKDKEKLLEFLSKSKGTQRNVNRFLRDLPEYKKEVLDKVHGKTEEVKKQYHAQRAKGHTHTEAIKHTLQEQYHEIQHATQEHLSPQATSMDDMFNPNFYTHRPKDRVEQQIHHLAQNIKGNSSVKHIVKHFNDIKSDLSKEKQKFIKQHPELMKDIEAYIATGKHSKLEILHFINQLEQTAHTAKLDITSPFEQHTDSIFQAHPLTRQERILKQVKDIKKVATKAVNDTKDNITKLATHVKENLHKVKEEHKHEVPSLDVTSHVTPSVKQVSHKLVHKKPDIQKVHSTNTLDEIINGLSNKRKVFFTNHPELKEQLHTYLLSGKHNKKDISKYITTLEKSIIPTPEHVVNAIDHATNVVHKHKKQLHVKDSPITHMDSLPKTGMKGKLHSIWNAAKEVMQSDQGSVSTDFLLGRWGKSKTPVPPPHTPPQQHTTATKDTKKKKSKVDPTTISMDYANPKAYEKFLNHMKKQGLILQPIHAKTLLHTPHDTTPPHTKDKKKDEHKSTTSITDILHSQLVELRSITLNTSESAYNGILAAAMQSGDPTVIDKLLKRPGVLRRAARHLRGMTTDIHESMKDAILIAKSKSTKFRRSMKSVGSGIKSVSKFVGKVAISPYTVPYGIAKHAIVDFMDIYRKDDPTVALVTKSQFKNKKYKKQFGDSFGTMDEHGKPITSIYDIKGPIYERTLLPKDQWNEPLISDEDIDAGLVDSKGKPINRLITHMGRATKFGVKQTGKGLYHTGKFGLHVVGAVAKGAFHATLGLHTGALSVAKAIFMPFPDVYVVGMDLNGPPFAYGKDIERYGYFNKKGTLIKVKSCYDIDSPVIKYDIKTKRNTKGNDNENYMITPEALQKGLITKKGEPLNKLSSKLGRGLSKTLGFIKDSIGFTLGLGGLGIASIWRHGSNIAHKLFKAKDKFQDVYIKGFVGPGKVVVYGKDIENRKIVYADDGTLVKSCYEIDRPVMKYDPDASDHKRTLIEEKDIKTGLVNIDGEKLNKWNSHSLGGKIVRGAGYALAGVAKGLWKGAKLYGKGMLGLLKLGGKALGKGSEFALWGSEIVDNMLTSLGHVFGSRKERIMKKDLKELVSDKLDKIHKVLDTRLGNKSVKFDRDKSGYRDGSMEDIEKQKEEKAKERQDRKYGKGRTLKDKLKGAVATGASNASEGGGSLVGGVVDAAKDAVVGHVAGKYGGKVLGKLANSKILSKIPGVGKMLGWGARALGAAGEASTLMGAGTVAAEAAGTAATLGTVGTAAAATEAGVAGAGAVAGSTGLMAGLGTAIASNPVGWAVGAGLLLGLGAYGIYKWMTHKSKEEKDLLDARCKLYGCSSEQADAVDKLEGKVFKTLKGDSKFDDHALEDLAKEFGCFDKSDAKESVQYFNTWIMKRFSPIFDIFLHSLNVVGLDYKTLSSVDEVKTKDIKQMLHGASSIAQDYDNLKPTLEAFKATKGKDEPNKKSNKDKTEKEKEDERKAKEAKEKENSAKKDIKVNDVSKATSTTTYAAHAITPTTDKKQGPNVELPLKADGTVDAAKAHKISRTVREGLHGNRNESTNVPLVQSSGAQPNVLSPTGTPNTVSSATPSTATTKALNSIHAASKSKTPVNDTTSTTSPSDTQSTTGTLSSGSYKFGKQTAKMEAGGNPGMVSKGDKWGDPGGISYGKYQFASKAHIPEKFINSPEAGKYGEILKNAGPVNSPEFKKAWQELGKDPGFEEAQDKFGKKMYLDGPINKNAPWLAKRSPMVQEALMHAYMGSGNQGKYMINAINKAGGEKLSDKEILQLMDTEYKNNIGKTKGFWAGQKKDKTFLKKYGEQQRVLLAAQDEYDKNKAAGAAGGSTTQLATNTNTSTTMEGNAKKDVLNPSTTNIVDSSSKSLIPTITSAASTPQAANAKQGVNVVGSEKENTATKMDPKEALSKIKKEKPSIDLDGMTPQMKQAVAMANADFMAKFKRPFLATSGKRTMEQQAALYKEKGPSQAAKPNPNAPHIKGIALDVNSPDADKLDESGILSKYGLSRPLLHGKGRVKPERWHIQMTGTPPETTPEDTSGKEPSQAEVKRDVGQTADGTPTPANAKDNVASNASGSDSAIGSSGNDNLTSSTGNSFSANVPGLTDTPAPVSDTTTAPTATSNGASNAGGSTNMMLEQLKLIASILGNIDKSTGTMAGWDLTKLGNNDNANTDKNKTGDPSGKPAAASGKVDTPVAKNESLQTPSNPAASKNPDTTRPVTPPMKVNKPVVPLGVRRNGRQPIDT